MSAGLETPEFKQLEINAKNARLAWILAQQKYMEANQDLKGEKYEAMLKAEDDFIFNERELIGYVLDRIEEINP